MPERTNAVLFSRIDCGIGVKSVATHIGCDEAKSSSARSTPSRLVPDIMPR